MVDEPPKEVQNEPGADERLERGVSNALTMPPKPHKPAQSEPPEAGRRKGCV